MPVLVQSIRPTDANPSASHERLESSSITSSSKQEARWHVRHINSPHAHLGRKLEQLLTGLDHALHGNRLCVRDGYHAQRLLTDTHDVLEFALLGFKLALLASDQVALGAQELRGVLERSITWSLKVAFHHTQG